MNNSKANSHQDIVIDNTSLDMLIQSSLKCIENIISESQSPNSFFKTLFSLAVNDCLVHLIVIDMCIDNICTSENKISYTVLRNNALFF